MYLGGLENINGSEVPLVVYTIQSLVNTWYTTQKFSNRGFGVRLSM